MWQNVTKFEDILVMWVTSQIRFADQIPLLVIPCTVLIYFGEFRFSFREITILPGNGLMLIGTAVYFYRRHSIFLGGTNEPR